MTLAPHKSPPDLHKQINIQKKHWRHTAAYDSAPPITSICVSSLMRAVNGASALHTMHTASSLVTDSARGMSSSTRPNGLR